MLVFFVYVYFPVLFKLLTPFALSLVLGPLPTALLLIFQILYIDIYFFALVLSNRGCIIGTL